MNPIKRDLLHKVDRNARTLENTKPTRISGYVMLLLVWALTALTILALVARGCDKL